MRDSDIDTVLVAIALVFAVLSLLLNGYVALREWGIIR
jgi:hypothetical protein